MENPKYIGESLNVVGGCLLKLTKGMEKRRVEEERKDRKSLARLGRWCERESVTWMELVANMSTRNGSWSVNVKARKLNRPLRVNAIVIVSLTARLPSHNYKTGFNNDSVHQSLWLNFTWDAFANYLGLKRVITAPVHCSATGIT